MAKGYTRKNYFINKQFQASFIFKFCLVVVVSSLVIASLIFMYSQDSTTVAIENTKVQVKQTQDFILPIVVRVLIIVSFFSAASVALLSLFVSHKIAGPLFRMKREVDLMAQGDLQRNFSLRGDDQLQELGKSLNNMTKYLKKNYNHIKLRTSDLSKYLQKKNYALSEEDRGSVEKILNDINEELEKIYS